MSCRADAMLAVSPPAYGIRPAERSEANLIADLRLAWLVSLEMPNYPLKAIRAVMEQLPDLGPDFVGSGRYHVAEHMGELIGGAGWSLLPLRFRLGGLFDASGQAATLGLAAGSVLVRGFFLDPDLGRRGIGAGLMAGIEADAARAGHAAAEILAPESAALLYRSLGFRPLRRLALRLPVGGDLPLVQLRKAFGMSWAAAA